MKIEDGLVCNMCQSGMSYYECNGTHIWVCDGGGEEGEVGCPNIQFEYIDERDLINLQRFLNGRQKTSSRNTEALRAKEEYER